MASSLLQWEADPFFPAAEEVQNSADRMMSAFRNWRNLKGLGEFSDVSIRTPRRELITALDTVKWQVEEFERAVVASAAMEQPHFSKEASSRHGIFVKAIRSQVCYAEKVLEEAAGPYESQATCIQSNFEDRDSLVDFLSGRLSEADAGSHVDHSSAFQLQNDCTIPRLFIANENVEKGNSKLVLSPRSKITPISSSISADCYLIKQEIKDNVVHRQEDKSERTVSLEDYETVRQKPVGHLGKFSTVSYGCETSMSSCAPNVWTSAGMSLEVVDNSTEAEQTRHGINMWEAQKTTGSSPVSDSDLKRWTDGKANCMEHLDNVSPFSVIQMLKGASVNDLEQGPRIRLGNYQKVPTGHTASELESYEKERTIAWRKAVQFRLWMLQRIPHGRTLQLVSALLIVISFVGISVF